MIRFNKLFSGVIEKFLRNIGAKILLSFVFFIITFLAFSEIKFSKKQDRTLYQILDLQTISAQRIINNSRKEDPEDIYLEYLENWKEVIELIGYEDLENYELYVKSFDNRLKRIDSWQNHESEAYLINLAEMYGHAGLANVMYGDYMSGFRKLLKANNLSK
jgi:hypothetical protein